MFISIHITSFNTFTDLKFKIMDPSTFEPVVSFMTRYGYKELTNTASSLGNAADYVDAITLAN